MLPKEEGEDKPKKTFKVYELGFVQIDIKYLPQMLDEDTRRYLFVAIDRATRWVYLRVHHNQTEASSTDFLRRLRQVGAFKIIKILTDNGTQFTCYFSSKDEQPTGKNTCSTSNASRRALSTGSVLPGTPKPMAWWSALMDALARSSSKPASLAPLSWSPR